MKTIKSIQWRAKREALKKVLSEIKHNIHEEVEALTEWIEDEENNKGNLPDNVE